MRALLALTAIPLLLTLQVWSAPSSVELEALLGNTAVLMINGERKSLRVGESFAGVTLVAAQSTTATLAIDGRQQTVGLSQRVATAFQQAQEHVVTIPRDAMMQYQTNALINGRSVLVLVDTGANTVAMSSRQAEAMNIDYKAGAPSLVETASGQTAAHAIMLQSINVGGIHVESVPALVLEGEYPASVLLGMSYLRHVKLQEDNGILSLSRTR